jgi:hypothetical protein
MRGVRNLELVLQSQASQQKGTGSSMSHFNIQITVQEVLDSPVKTGPLRTSEEVKRRSVETVRVNVTAPTEAEAFAKARKLMDAAEPEPVNDNVVRMPD